MTGSSSILRMTLAALMATALGTVALAQAASDAAPAAPSDANAGATPIVGDSVYKAFHGEEGVKRVASNLVDRYTHDPRIEDIFRGSDTEHLKLMLFQQFCYLLGGPCHYSGKDMTAAHKDMGLQRADFNALVEDLQWAMDKEGVPQRAQNHLLAKLAPMERVVVTR